MPDRDYNILMYSHDTYGLGHIRRTMAIASHLLDRDVNVLILTGSPIVGRFAFPEGVDFVRIPGMIKKTNSIYLPHSIKVDAKHAMTIRRKIITATAKAFDPKLFIVDKAPMGLKREVVPTLRWFKKHRPQTKCILGLRDIMDDAESTREEWSRKNIYEVLRTLYSEVWVYGNRDIYDPIREYGIPPEIARKMVFTGYIPRRKPKHDGECLINGNGNATSCGVSETRTRREKTVLVTIGGGGDGYPVLDSYLRMAEQTKPGFRTIMVTGPFLSPDHCDEVARRAKRAGIKLLTFNKRLEKLMEGADLVVSMGGYNTVCEILSMQKVSLIVPRDTPRREQLLRAGALKKRGLLDYIPWDNMTPGLLREKIDHLLDNPEPYLESIRNFAMPGLEVMRERLAAFRSGKE